MNNTRTKKTWIAKINQSIDKQTWLKSLILFGTRIYLAPLFLIPGWQQLNNFERTVVFFGDDLQMPYPFVLSIIAISTQLIAGFALMIGLLTRCSALLLAIIITVIIFAVQIDNGWYYIIEYNSAIEQIITLIQQYSNYDQLIQTGEIVIFANGVEFSILYLLMLLMLFSYGGGKLSLDAYLLGK